MKPYWKLSIWYLVTGVLWILFSDAVVRGISEDLAELTWLQTAKGWFFVFASTVLIGTLSRRAYLAKEADERAKKAVFQATVDGACHILLNYLNQMQLVTLEAETCAQFDRGLLRVAREVSDTASEELKKLQQLEFATPEDIERFIYRATLPR